MRAIVARALRKEALSAAPPPNAPDQPQLVHNVYRHTDVDGNLWGDQRITYYRALKRIKRQDSVAKVKRERKPRRDRGGRVALDVGRVYDALGFYVGRRLWKEGEPLIVIAPMTHIARHVDFDVLNKIRGEKGVHGGMPKHFLDWVAQGGT